MPSIRFVEPFPELEPIPVLEPIEDDELPAIATACPADTKTTTKATSARVSLLAVTLLQSP
jgi:hypothetical protein